MVAKNASQAVDIEAVFRDGDEIDRAMEMAAGDARLDHKRTGDPSSPEKTAKSFGFRRIRSSSTSHRRKADLAAA